MPLLVKNKIYYYLFLLLILFKTHYSHSISAAKWHHKTAEVNYSSLILVPSFQISSLSLFLILF